MIDTDWGLGEEEEDERWATGTGTVHTYIRTVLPLHIEYVYGGSRRISGSLFTSSTSTTSSIAILLSPPSFHSRCIITNKKHRTTTTTSTSVTTGCIIWLLYAWHYYCYYCVGVVVEIITVTFVCSSSPSSSFSSTSLLLLLFPVVCQLFSFFTFMHLLLTWRHHILPLVFPYSWCTSYFFSFFSLDQSGPIYPTASIVLSLYPIDYYPWKCCCYCYFRVWLMGGVLMILFHWEWWVLMMYSMSNVLSMIIVLPPSWLIVRLK